MVIFGIPHPAHTFNPESRPRFALKPKPQPPNEANPGSRKPTENLLLSLCRLSHACPLGWEVGGECALVSGSAIAPHCVTTGSLHSSLRS